MTVRHKHTSWHGIKFRKNETVKTFCKRNKMSTSTFYRNMSRSLPKRSKFRKIAKKRKPRVIWQVAHVHIGYEGSISKDIYKIEVDFDRWTSSPITVEEWEEKYFDDVDRVVKSLNITQVPEAWGSGETHVIKFSDLSKRKRIMRNKVKGNMHVKCSIETGTGSNRRGGTWYGEEDVIYEHEY